MQSEIPRVDASDDCDKLLLFERFLALHQACWALSVLAFEGGALRWNAVPSLAALVLGASALRNGIRWRGLRALASLSVVLTSWPLTSTHGLFGSLLTLLMLLLAGEPSTALRFLQRALLVICFGAGMQKLLHGTWWSGSFLAYEVVNASRFEFAMRWLLPAEDWAHLRSLRGDAVGTGPYTLSFAPLWLARLIVMLEVGLPLCALRSQFKPLAHVGLLLLAISFALVARELLFGGLFIALNALVWPRALLRNTLFSVVVAYALGAALWVVTEGRAWS